MRKATKPGEPRRVNLKVSEELLVTLHEAALKERTSLQDLAVRWLTERAQGTPPPPREEQG